MTQRAASLQIELGKKKDMTRKKSSCGDLKKFLISNDIPRSSLLSQQRPLHIQTFDSEKLSRIGRFATLQQLFFAGKTR